MTNTRYSVTKHVVAWAVVITMLFQCLPVSALAGTIFSAPMNPPETTTVTFVDSKDNDRVLRTLYLTTEGAVNPDDVPPVPEHDHYAFKGWYEGKTQVSFSNYQPAESVTITAEYDEAWLLTFYDRDAREYQKVNVVKDQAVGDQLPAPIAREDYTPYWAIGTIVEGNQGPEINPSGSRIGSSFVPQQDETIVPDYDMITRTVTFYADEGKTEILTTRTVNVNTSYCVNEIPAVPTREDYSSKWVYSGGDFNNSASAKEGDLEVWPEFVQDVFVVTYLVEDETFKTDKYYRGTHDTLILPEAPSVEGKDFNGWYDGETQYTGGETVTSDLTLVAQFGEQYLVSFVVPGEDGQEDEVLLSQYFRSAGEAIQTLPQSPFRAGEIFDKWVDQDTGYEVTADTVVNKNIIAEARFREIEVYEITVEYYYLNDQNQEVVSGTDILNIEVQQFPYTIMAPETVKTAANEVSGAPFYYPEVQSITIENTDGFDTDRKQTVRFKFVPATAEYDFVYLLKDLVGDGYTEIPNTREHHSGVSDSYVTPTVKTFDFAVLELVEGKNVKNGDRLPVYYTRKYFQLSYETNGGSYVGGVTVPYQTNQAITSTVPTRTGYIFAGWYLNEALTQRAGNTVTVNDDVTIYAKWNPDNADYTIVYLFEKYDDTGTTASFVFDKSESARGQVGSTVRASSATAQNRTGWVADTAQNNNSSVTIKADGSSVLFVYYKLVPYTLKFDRNHKSKHDDYIIKPDGTTTTSTYTITVKIGQDISTLWPSADCDDCNFRGWQKNKSGTRYITKQLIMNTDLLPSSGTSVTYYANWGSGNRYTVNYYFENADDDGYTKSDSYSQTYYSDSTSLTPKTINGYTHDHSQNSGTTFNFYYRRNRFGIQYNYGSTNLNTLDEIKFDADINKAPYVWTPTTTECGVDSDFTFDGWYSDSGLTTKYTFNRMPAGNTDGETALILYAKWKAPTYTVRFVDTDGSSLGIADQTVEKYKRVQALDASPTKQGYSFDGWYTSSTGTALFDWTTQITEDTTVYAHWIRHNLSYTVHYVDEGGQSVAADKVVTDPNYTVGQSVTESPISVAGYRPKTTSATISLADNNANNVITFEYASKTQTTSYTVRYILDPEEYPGDIPVAEAKSVNNVPGDTSSVVEQAKAVDYTTLVAAHPELDGIVFLPDAVEKTLVLTANAESNVYTFYYSGYRKATVTVHYVDMAGTAIPGINVHSETLKVGNSFTLSTPPINGWEYKKAVVGSNYNGTSASGTYKITNTIAQQGSLEFTIFYQKKATIQVVDQTRQYNGEVLTLPEDLNDQVKTEGLMSGDSLTSLGYSYTNADSENPMGRLNAGVATVMPRDAVISGHGQTPNYYTIRYISGTLEVTKINVTVRIEPDRWTGNIYNGTKRYTGFTNNTKLTKDKYIFISFEAYKTQYLDTIWNTIIQNRNLHYDASLPGLHYYAIAEKDAGEHTYNIAFTEADLPDDPNYSVNLFVRPGLLEIKKKPLTITTGSAEKFYDGTPLTEPTANISGLVTGETATITATGSQTVMGFSDNTYSISWGTAKEENYNIKENLGTLQVKPVNLTVTVNQFSTPYNGSEQSGYTFPASITGTGETITTDEYTVTGLIAGDMLEIVYRPAKGTKGGTYDNSLFESTYRITRTVDGEELDVTSSYHATFTKGDLQITALWISIVTDSATKAYDGRPLTAGGTATFNGVPTTLIPGEETIVQLLNNDTVKIKVTGSQTDVGSSGNTYEVIWINPYPDSSNYLYYDAAPLGTLEVKQNYTVTYSVSGEVPANYHVPVDNTNYMEGDTVEVRPTPSIPGYSFRGWNKDGSVVSSFTMPASNVVLRGEFSENEVRIIYCSEDDTLGNVSPSDSNVKVVRGEAAQAIATVQRVGYEFSHWTVNVDDTWRSTASTLTPAKEDDPAANGLWTTRTYTAHFKPIDYTVTYTVTGEIPAGYTVPAGVDSAHVGDTINVAVKPTQEGYTFTGWTYNNQSYDGGTLTMPAENVEFTGVWSKNEYPYTVHHYLKGTTIQVKADDTGSAKFDSTVTATPATTYQSLNLTVDSYNPSQSITITTDEGQNVITVYYTLPLTITAKTDSKTYDGTPLNGAYTINGALAADQTAIETALGTAPSITNVSESPRDYQAVTTRIPVYYTVTNTPGTLTIEPATMTLEVSDAEYVYDGQEHTITVNTADLPAGTTVYYATAATWSTTPITKTNAGTYTIYVKAENPNYEATPVKSAKLKITKRPITLYDSATETYKGSAIEFYLDTSKATGVVGDETLVFTGFPYIRGTNVGTYDSVNNKNSWRVTKADSSLSTDNYTLDVSGLLTITGKEVQVKANNAEKFYDNNPNNPVKYTATVNGLIGSDTITYTVTRLPGENVGEYTITPSGDAVQGNYLVTYETGTFTIKPRSVTVTIKGQKSIVDYDGDEHSVSGYDVTIGNPLYTSADFTFSGTAEAARTNVGTTNMGLTTAQFTNNNANFNVTFSITDGYQKINPINVTVTITGHNDTKTYTGSEQSVTGYEISIPEGATLTEEEIHGPAQTAAIAKGTDVDGGSNADKTYPMGLAAGAFSTE
ncbi:MAG: InlB B-repeat-containing protein, partial [Bacteroidales bacterium]|nr:InlB B-repeat-containing protein [Bacteroidales bacterium]